MARGHPALRGVEPAAVVHNRDDDAGVVEVGRDDHGGGLRVPAYVLERLEHDRDRLVVGVRVEGDVGAHDRARDPGTFLPDAGDLHERTRERLVERGGPLEDDEPSCVLGSGPCGLLDLEDPRSVAIVRALEASACARASSKIGESLTWVRI